MAGPMKDGGDETISEINIVPLVDIILVLLIIFMITAPTLYQSSIQLDLPTAKSGKKSEKSSFAFSLTKEGELFWNDEKVDWNKLDERLKAAAQSSGADKAAVVKADKLVPHGQVIRLLDALRMAGVFRINLTVEGGDGR